MVSRHRAFAEPNKDNIDEPIISDRQRVRDTVYRPDQEKHQEVFGVDENENDDAHFQYEQDVWNAEHHGRPGKATHEWIKMRLILLTH
jgi:hypothetical protein